MPKRDSYRLVLLSDGASKKGEVRFSRRAIAGAAIGAVLLFGLVTFGGSRLIASLMTRRAMAEVIDENKALHAQIGSLSTRLDEVKGQIATLATSDDHLRLLADLPPIDKDVRAVGIGGSVAPDPDLGVQDPKVRELIDDLDKLTREIRLQKDSFSEIESHMKERQDLIAHTPSIRPVNGGYLSSGFGRRKDPFNGRTTHHNGLDIPVARGTAVMASAEGRVVFAKATPGLGKLVVIDHGNGFQTAYGHLNSINVSKGQTVERSQKIGTVGNSGRSTGPHLHYEVHVNGDAVDPLDFFFDGSESIASLR